MYGRYMDAKHFKYLVVSWIADHIIRPQAAPLTQSWRSEPSDFIFTPPESGYLAIYLALRDDPKSQKKNRVDLRTSRRVAFCAQHIHYIRVKMGREKEERT